jgi:DNA-binding NarL/FixJ family response regulator
MRVVLAEDLVLLRDGLTSTLREQGFEVVAAVDNGPALLHDDPDVAVVDIRLPPTHTDEGLQAALAARRQRSGLPILILSQYVEQLYARELLAESAGAIGYLLKDRVTHTDQFVDALTRVAKGGTVMDPQVIAKLLARNDARGTTAELTPREHDVLRLMAEGRSNAAISTHLHVSDSAVNKHIASIFSKLRLAHPKTTTGGCSPSWRTSTGSP